MSHSCQQSICVDKPSLDKLNNNKTMTGIHKLTEDEKNYPERPLYRTEFGNSTWKVLHRMVAAYPNQPTETDKNNMSLFFDSLASVFPCPECAEHFQQGNYLI